MKTVLVATRRKEIISLLEKSFGRDVGVKDMRWCELAGVEIFSGIYNPSAIYIDNNLSGIDPFVLRDVLRLRKSFPIEIIDCESDRLIIYKERGKAIPFET